MILRDCEVYCVKSVGGRRYSTMIEIFQNGSQNQNGRLSIDAETYSEEHPLHLCGVWCVLYVEVIKP